MYLFFVKEPATTQIYTDSPTRSQPDALPICGPALFHIPPAQEWTNGDIHAAIHRRETPHHHRRNLRQRFLDTARRADDSAFSLCVPQRRRDRKSTRLNSSP